MDINRITIKELIKLSLTYFRFKTHISMYLEIDRRMLDYYIVKNYMPDKLKKKLIRKLRLEIKKDMEYKSER